VAILSHSSDRYIETAFAILSAGGVAVPLSTRATRGELAGTVRDSDARTLFVSGDFLGVLPARRAEGAALAHVLYMGEQEAPSGTHDYETLVRCHAEAPRGGRGGSDLAAIYYTGGTTGRPKGVMLSHANLYANALHGIAQFRFDERSVYLHAGPLYHLAAGSRILTAAIVGATQVVIPRFAVEDVLAAIETHKVTMTPWCDHDVHAAQSPTFRRDGPVEPRPCGLRRLAHTGGAPRRAA
jgi:long-chain acyl-CoA synthetase